MKNRKGVVGAFFDRKFDALDLIILSIVFCAAILVNSHWDILVTGNRGFIVQNHPFSFYDVYYDWSGGDYGLNYLPSTFWLYAIWDLPLRLFGFFPTDSFTLTKINMLWYRLLTFLCFYIVSVFIKKIFELFPEYADRAKLAQIAFLLFPVGFFSQFLWNQYDIFWVLFSVIGYYLFLTNKETAGALTFGFALTFKYQAIVFFLVLVCLREKKIFTIIKRCVLALLPALIEIALVWHNKTFIKHVFGFFALDYAKSGFTFGAISDLNLCAVVLFICIIVSYMKTIETDKDFFLQSIYLLNGACFALYGFMKFHPQWILGAVPFWVIGMLTHKNEKIMSILQWVFVVFYYPLIANLFGGVEHDLHGFMILRNIIPSAWPLTMKDVYLVTNTGLLFAVVFSIMALNFYNSRPNNATESENDSLQFVRLNVRVGILIAYMWWTIPFMICLHRAL